MQFLNEKYLDLEFRTAYEGKLITLVDIKYIDWTPIEITKEKQQKLIFVQGWWFLFLIVFSDMPQSIRDFDVKTN